MELMEGWKEGSCSHVTRNTWILRRMCTGARSTLKYSLDSLLSSIASINQFDIKSIAHQLTINDTSSGAEWQISYFYDI